MDEDEYEDDEGDDEDRRLAVCMGLNHSPSLSLVANAIASALCDDDGLGTSS